MESFESIFSDIYNPEDYEGNNKFKTDDKIYFEYIDELKKMHPTIRDLVYDFPIFIGHVNLSRYIFFYELYKKTISYSGNIAEIGTYKGASFLFWAKLIKIFERYNTTQVFGFDWFQGMETGENDNPVNDGLYKASYNDLIKMIKLQRLEEYAVIEKMDVVAELHNFIANRPYLRFKLIFIDCGIRDVIEVSLKELYPRLVQGGVLIFDHYNMAVSPSESDIVEKYIGRNKVYQMPFNRHSSGYIIKEV